jgi:hypothetical protein
LPPLNAIAFRVFSVLSNGTIYITIRTVSF